jgi:hypothetical protein
MALTAEDSRVAVPIACPSTTAERSQFDDLRNAPFSPEHIGRDHRVDDKPWAARVAKAVTDGCRP